MSSSTSVVDAVGLTGNGPRGPAIDVVFNLDGGHCQTHRQRPLGGLPSTSSTSSVVDATRPTDSTPPGAYHRRLLQPP
jgi:hypothetical protein